MAPRRRAVVLGLAAVIAVAVLAVDGCSRQSGSRRAFCVQVAKVPPLNGVLTGYSEADPGELTRRLTTTRRAYDDLRSAAPSAIDDETDAMVDLVDDILDAVDDHRRDPTAVRDAIRTSLGEHAAAGPGAAEVAAYASDRCGVELDPTMAPTTTSG